MFLYIYQQIYCKSYLETDKLRFSIVNYSSQLLNIVLQMKSKVNKSLTLVCGSKTVLSYHAVDKPNLLNVQLYVYVHFCQFGVPYIPPPKKQKNQKKKTKPKKTTKPKNKTKQQTNKKER